MVLAIGDHACSQVLELYRNCMQRAVTFASTLFIDRGTSGHDARTIYLQVPYCLIGP